MFTFLFKRLLREAQVAESLGVSRAGSAHDTKTQDKFNEWNRFLRVWRNYLQGFFSDVFWITWLQWQIPGPPSQIYKSEGAENGSNNWCLCLHGMPWTEWLKQKLIPHSSGAWEIPRYGSCQSAQVLARVLFLACRCPSSCCVLTSLEVGERVLCVFL